MTRRPSLTSFHFRYDSGSIQVTPVHTLAPHADAVDFIAWSPDDKLILSCSGSLVRLWDVASGGLLHVYDHKESSVCGVAWMPDSTTYFSGAGREILELDVNGCEIQRIKRPTRIQDLALTPDGKNLIVAGSDRFISIISIPCRTIPWLPEMGCEISFQESSAITSLTLTSIDNN